MALFNRPAGMCLVNCPFGAIVDKGQIFQLIQSIKRGDDLNILQFHYYQNSC